MSIPQNWQATAFNTSPHSDNQIHSDEMAHAYGFKGGLVPGVVVSAYLIHPAVEAWGLKWLKRGHAKVVVHKPTYDGDGFSVDLTDICATSYSAVLSDPSGTRNATAEISLKDALPEPPEMRGDPVLHSAASQRPEASLAVMRELQGKGLSAMDIKWEKNKEIVSYLCDPDSMPDLHQLEKGGYANAAFMLGLTNWVLAANVYMNPWIHLQTESQNYAPVPYGTPLRVECDIHDLFNKGGHEFVDLNVNTFIQPTGQPVMSTLLRAIYKMRAAD